MGLGMLNIMSGSVGAGKTMKKLVFRWSLICVAVCASSCSYLSKEEAFKIASTYDDNFRKLQLFIDKYQADAEELKAKVDRCVLKPTPKATPSPTPSPAPVAK